MGNGEIIDFLYKGACFIAASTLYKMRITFANILRGYHGAGE